MSRWRAKRGGLNICSNGSRKESRCEFSFNNVKQPRMADISKPGDGAQSMALCGHFSSV